jgi:16S rRNA (cytidine1402-2'-O)-methyltransferase
VSSSLLLKEPTARIKEKSPDLSRLSTEELVRHYEEKGLSRMEAMKQAARDLGISKRDVYRSLL